MMSSKDLRIDLSVNKLTKSFYATLDDIAGRIIYSPQSTVEVHDVTIDFLGVTKTWVDPLSPGATRGRASKEVDTTPS